MVAGEENPKHFWQFCGKAYVHLIGSQSVFLSFLPSNKPKQFFSDIVLWTIFMSHNH